METERQYTHMDKSDWGEGAWQAEPDKLQWIDEATDLDCLIVRNRMGGLCGYVGLPPGHPLHGQADYMDIDVDVHGGLTFADSCHEEGAVESSICHVPFPGRPDNVWWLGFDCGHWMDLLPAMVAHEQALGFPPVPGDYVYRDVAWVRAECARLAQQLAEAGA